MFDGLTILSEAQETPRSSVLLSIIMMIVCSGLICFAILFIQEYKSDKHIGKLILAIIFIVLAVAGTFGITAMLMQRQTVYKIILPDNYSANMLFEKFDILHIDGLIYEVIPKN